MIYGLAYDIAHTAIVDISQKVKTPFAWVLSHTSVSILLLVLFSVTNLSFSFSLSVQYLSLFWTLLKYIQSTSNLFLLISVWLNIYKFTWSHWLCKPCKFTGVPFLAWCYFKNQPRLFWFDFKVFGPVGCCLFIRF